MPFIDPSFLLDETVPVQRVLMTSADDCDVVKISFELSKLLAEKGNSVLWVDGNLGENSLDEATINPNLEKVLRGHLPLTHVIQDKEGIFVLGGLSECFLAELSEKEQFQFLQDLKNLYPNFDKIILSVDGKNPDLQKKWMSEAQNVYLLFNTKNILLNRTLNWLKENKEQTKGLIGIGENDQEVLLAYMRLKAVLGDIPELILDIKKIAP